MDEKYIFKYKLQEESIAGSKYLTLDFEDFEDRNPKDVIMNLFMNQKLELNKFTNTSSDYCRVKNGPDQALMKAFNDYSKIHLAIESIQLPREFISLLDAPDKSKQENALRSFKFNSLQFLKFLLYAHDTHDYLYSRFNQHHFPNNFNKDLLPRMAILDSGEIQKSDDSNLSDGQIKQAILQQNFNTIHLLTKANSWHCFFHTIDGIRGLERNGTEAPHMHYISDKYTLEKEVVIASLKKKGYKMSSFHVGFNPNQNTMK